MPNGIVAALFLAAGVLFFFLGTVAIFRLPDVHSRLTVMFKSLVFGMAALVIARFLLDPGWLHGLKLITVWLLLYMAGIIARRWLLRVAEARGTAPWNL